MKMSSSNMSFSFRFLFASLVLLNILYTAKCENDVEIHSTPASESSDNHNEFVERYINNKDPALDIDGFEKCDLADCQQICGTKEKAKAFCDPKNKKLCMCAMENFMTSNVEGIINAVNREDPRERNCSFACNIRNSYARIWSRNDETKSCNCLLNQLTTTGITLCDEFAIKDLCKTVCRSKHAVCAFNGICLCRSTWPEAFRLKLPTIRNEVPADKQECSNLCVEYSTEYVPRIYDSKMDEKEVNRNYDFRDKYCLCGAEEKELGAKTMADKLHEQGFQQCTGLKCKLRCGMNWEAQCVVLFLVYGFYKIGKKKRKFLKKE